MADLAAGVESVNYGSLIFKEKRKMVTDLEGNYPDQYESWLTLKDGSRVFLRPVMERDSPLLIELFKKMSPKSVWLRFLRHLDSLSEEMVCRFTHVNYSSQFALVAVVNEDGKDSIIAVGRYADEPEEEGTELAVAVRDDWHHLGLGKALLRNVVDIAREHGISRFVGMIDPHNTIIRLILLQLGYGVNYSFKDGFFQVQIAV